jgi:prepilin-type N-terminal cleavage/methylation domain-containing protein
MDSSGRERVGRRAFTLLEMLMVVVIIGILATLAVPQYQRTVERASAAEALQNLAAIRSAQLRYSAQHNAFTVALPTLDTEVPVTTGGWSFSAIGKGFAGLARARAERVVSGVGTGKYICINYLSGWVCATDPVYGQPAPTNIAFQCRCP